MHIVCDVLSLLINNPEYSKLSDEEIQHILNYMHFVIDFAHNKQMKQLWESKVIHEKLR